MLSTSIKDIIIDAIFASIYYLRELKRSGVLQSDLVCIYLTLVRPVVEYAYLVWSTGLTKEQSQTLESIQKRALRII